MKLVNNLGASLRGMKKEKTFNHFDASIGKLNPLVELKSVVAILTTFIIASCGTAKITTNNNAKEITFVTVTNSMVAKQTEMTEEEIQSWPHADIFTDSIPGMSLAKAYDFVVNKKSKMVIVGVIDSGMDIEHEDLKDVIWTNKNEIANNGKDDDDNGYVDDINGWNFLGGEKGQSNPEQLEITRTVKKWMPRFDGKTADSIDEKEMADFNLFVKLKKVIDKKNADATKQATQYTFIRDFVSTTNDTIQKLLGKKEYSLTEVDNATLTNPSLMQGKMIIMRILDAGDTVDAALDQLNEIVNYYSSQVNSHYKISFNGRLTGDDPYNITDTNYGNGNVIGSKDTENHGTHVSGIIAAKRNNGIGMNGVANNVQIMALRVVPDGDEYDKDVALAIRYAADNGAKVINMSFGKGRSPNAEWVYDAIKYAESKDVLLVHAAGNDGGNFDVDDNFPNDSKDKLIEFADNVLTVGAITPYFDDRLVASFSNYGKNNVDIFAPGTEIYATYPKNNYKFEQGTSMAAPEVAGVAALIRSYYPNLTASQVKHIIMDSGLEYPNNVMKPAQDGVLPENINFNDLSVSGRILNAYNALLMADSITNKN